jgi:hypothetical protein
MADTPTAAGAHNMVVAIGIEVAAVFIAILIAGTSQTAGRTLTGVMFLLLFLQGVGHVNPIFQLITKNPLVPAPASQSSATATEHAVATQPSSLNTNKSVPLNGTV